MKNINDIIRKMKKSQLIWISMFMLLALFCIYYFQFFALIIFPLFALWYFIKRILNIESLIKYYEDNPNKDTINKESFIYASGNNEFCDHVFISDNYIVIVDNDVKIIPINKIEKIIMTQEKGIINSTKAGANTSKWQNTALMTLGRGYPDTIYCFYSGEIILNDNQIIKTRLIKKVGEEFIFTIKNKIPIKINEFQFDKFEDTKDIKKGKNKFIITILPGSLFLISLAFMFIGVSFGKNPLSMLFFVIAFVFMILTIVFYIIDEKINK